MPRNQSETKKEHELTCEHCGCGQWHYIEPSTNWYGTDITDGVLTVDSYSRDGEPTGEEYLECRKCCRRLDIPKNLTVDWN